MRQLLKFFMQEFPFWLKSYAKCTLKHKNAYGECNTLNIFLFGFRDIRTSVPKTGAHKYLTSNKPFQ